MSGNDTVKSQGVVILYAFVSVGRIFGLVVLDVEGSVFWAFRMILLSGLQSCVAEFSSLAECRRV